MNESPEHMAWNALGERQRGAAWFLSALWLYWRDNVVDYGALFMAFALNGLTPPPRTRAGGVARGPL